MEDNLAVKVVTMVVLALLVLMPLSSSIIIAASMPDANIHGQDELAGFSKGNGDILTFKAYITPNQDHDIEISEVGMTFPAYSTTLLFNDSFCISASCEEITGYAPTTQLCICESDWSVITPLDVVFTYDENNDGTIDAQLPEQLFPDFQPPEIILITASQEDDNIVLDYKVKDTACQSCQNKCSGIQNIKVADASGPIETIDISSENCNIEDEASFNYTDEGLNEFTILLYDNLWSSPDDDVLHKDTYSLNIETDFTSPSIGNELSIIKDGKNVTYLSSNGITASLGFTLTDRYLSTLSVTLSDIGSNNNIVNAPISQYCTGTEEYTCTINQVKISISEVKINITATDSFNNLNTKTLSKTLTLDDGSPVVNSIQTTKKYNDITYIKKFNNTFVVSLEESGSGMSQGNMYLNLNAIRQSSQKKADECIKSGSKWDCYYYNIDAIAQEGATLPIARTSPSFDDAGNPVTGLESIFAVYDGLDPLIKNITIVAIGETGERTYYQSGDIIKIIIEVDSLLGSPVTSANANLSELFIIPTNLEQGACELYEDTLYICTWETSPIKSGQYTADLHFTVSDAAGNEDTKTVKIPVYGITSETPDNFDVLIEKNEMIPRKINRLIASLIPNPPGYKILIPFRLMGGGNEVEVLSYQIKDCLVENSTNVYEQLFEDSASPTPSPLPTLLELTQAGEQNSFEMTLARFTAADINLLEDFDLGCDMYIYQRIGDKVYENPEIENITIRIQATDSALAAGPGEEVITQIKDAQTSLLKDTKFITDAAEVVSWLESACGIVTQIVGIWNIFAAIEGLGLALKKSTQKDWLYKIGCNGYEFFGSFIGKFYYGKQLGGYKFTTKRCKDGTKLEAELTGMGNAKLSSPKYVKDAALEWVGKGTNGKGFPGLRNICGFVSCEYSTKLAENIEKWTGGKILEGVNGSVGKEGSFFNSLLRFSTTAPEPNPKNSIVMSAATICIPGIIYNLDKYRQIQCRYIKCLKETAEAGGPVHICKAKKSQSWCMVIFGEFAETVGILRLVKSLSEQGAQVAADLIPNLLKALVDSTICAKKGTEAANAGALQWLIPIACDIPRAVYNVIDSYDRFKAIGRYADKDSWSLSGKVDDVCEEVLSPAFLGEEEETTGEEYPYGGGNMDTGTQTTTTYAYPFESTTTTT